MIKKFTSVKWVNNKQPDIRPISERMYELKSDFSIDFYARWNEKSGYFQLFIPKGFLVDGQSVPRIIWSFGFRPDGLVRQAALIHDAGQRTAGYKDSELYCFGCTVPCNSKTSEICRVFSVQFPILRCNGELVTLGRKSVDQLYLASYKYCAETAQPPSESEVRRAKIGYRFVRSLGWMYWGKESPNG